MGNQDTFNAIVRSDFRLFFERTFAELHPGTPYQDNWHMQAILYVLNQVLLGQAERVIITMPPRYGKSLATSVAMTAYMLGQDPTKRIITACYALELAEKLSMDTRRIMESPFYQNAFPDTRIGKGKNTSTHFSTTKGGSRYATSLGGSVTGMGADILIVDDLMKASILPSAKELDNASDYLQGTLFSRLNDKVNGQIVVIMQRLHEDDPVGRLIRNGGWEILNLPAIAEHDEDILIAPGKHYNRRKGEVLHAQREPMPVLQRIAEEMGPRVFGAQYQQRPVPAGGGIVEWSWFEEYDELPAEDPSYITVSSWDTAMVVSGSSSYTVGTTWRCYGDQYYLIDVWRHRRSSSELPDVIHNHALEHDPDLVLIESTNGSAALIHTLRRHSLLNIMSVKPDGSKAERMEAESPVLAAGRVHVPRQAEWLEAFRSEVIKFPEGQHDDQIDSLSQFLLWARTLGPDTPGGERGDGKPGGPLSAAAKTVGKNVSRSRIHFYGERRRVSLRGIDFDNFRL